jgi:hypothetical protein
MRKILFAVCLLPLPALAQDDVPGLTPESEVQGAPSAEMDEGLDLMQRGLESILRGFAEEMKPAIGEMSRALEDMRPMAIQLMELMKNVDQYEAPVMLDNGDILIRRKTTPTPLPEPPKDGEIDL